MSCASCRSPLSAEVRFCPNCGLAVPTAPAVSSDPLREVLKLALGRQYEVSRLLGKGGMGAVYLATEAALEREVAIKVLPPDRGATQESRDRFRREARTAAKLSHPNIVPLYTFGDVDGTLYFVMGYVKGESLATRLKREGRLPVEESRRILIEIAEALEYAHKLGVIHRDIKPDNVLIEESTGRALLTDFGVAKALGAGQTLTEVGGVLGTPQYMSPEQAQGKSDIDHRADLYSLGVMGYAMLAGRLPFEGATPGEVMVQHITKEAPALKSLLPDLPAEMATALTRCLAKDPGTRWPDARGFKTAISEAGSAGGLPETLVPVWRLTQVAYVGSVLGLYVWANRLMTPLNPLELSFLADVLPRLVLGFVAIALIAALGVAVEARTTGHAWREIARAATLKPQWWVGWYPARWRARADVWDRLPLDLRRGRTLVFFGSIAMLLVLPVVMMVALNANNFYKLTGRETALVRVHRLAGKNKLVGPAIVLAPYGVAALGIWFHYRWRRRAGSKVETKITEGALQKIADEIFIRDTANRSFWSRPEVAALLLPERSSASHASASAAGPPTATGLTDAISAVVSALPEPGRALGVEARAVARQLADAVNSLDKQIAGLARAFDPAEARRLATRLADLGPDKGPTDENRETREILQKQLEPVRSLETRLEDARARRSGEFELLKALWRHTVELQAASHESPDAASTTDQIRQLLARIKEQTGGARTIGDDSGGRTEALSDAPTIDR